MIPGSDTERCRARAGSVRAADLDCGVECKAVPGVAGVAAGEPAGTS
jgi:hypothetical protein